MMASSFNGAGSGGRVRITLGDKVCEASWDDAFAVGDELVNQFPELARTHGRPRFESIVAGAAPVAPAVRPAAERAPSSDRAPLDVKGGSFDVIGAARSQIDFEAALEAGFAPKQSVYRRGTRVIEAGVEGARASRVEWESRPLVRQYCQDFSRQIAGEDRRDRVEAVSGLRMTRAGLLVPGAAGVTRAVDLEKLAFSRDAFGSVLAAIGCGGREYLERCPVELRAVNFNWQAKGADADAKVKLRTRRSGRGGREVFAVVGERYASFDVDRIADALAIAAPADARGTVAYDGAGARFTITWQTNVQPEHFVAGEFYRAGVVVTTDDTGGGSIRVSPFVDQNLCLNMIILDHATGGETRIRHVGTVDALARRFSTSFSEALAKVEHFRRVWGYAVETDVLATVVAQEGSIPLSVALPGLFNGIIEQDLVEIRGDRKEVVRGLVRAWEQDDSAARVGRPQGTLSLASVVNAFTRYAHEVASDSPWVEDSIERAAGGLLGSVRSGRFDAPAPLPYLPIKL